MVEVQRDLTRQENQVPSDKIETPISIIGVGAVGRQVVLQLASMGFKNLQIIDNDNVELTNITTQGYGFKDIDKQKVHAVRDYLSEYMPDINLNAINDRWRPKYHNTQVVFSCVDSIKTREVIWKNISKKVKFFVDARMLGEVIRVISCKGGDEYYDKTLFQEEEAFQAGCTIPMTMYSASIAAGIMIHQFTRYLRDIRLNRDVIFNMIASSFELYEEK